MIDLLMWVAVIQAVAWFIAVLAAGAGTIIVLVFALIRATLGILGALEKHYTKE